MKETQAKQLKINVTKISSFLKDSNNTYIGLKKKNSALISRQEKRKQQEMEEKQLEKKPEKNYGLGDVGNAIASTGGSIFDKILGFGSFILTGVLVNSLPQILKTVKGVIDSIVDFVTPIQSAFSLIIGFFQGDFDTKKYDVDKKRVDDSLSQISGEGGLIDQIAKKAGPFEGFIKSLKPAIDLIRGKVGGKKKTLAKQGGKEGVLDTETGRFTEKPFTRAEREQYESQGKKPTSSPDNKPIGSSISSPVGPITPGGTLDFIGSGDGASGTLVLKDQKGKKLGSWEAISGVFRTANASQKDRRNVSGTLNPLPDGTYPLMGFAKHGYVDGVGTWSTFINNMTGSIGSRKDLLVHSDIGSNGTAGCVGVELGGRSGTDAEKKFLQLYEAAKPTSIRVAIGKGSKLTTPPRSTDNTRVTKARVNSVDRKSNQIATINQSMDEEGGQTIIIAKQKVIVG